MNYLPLIGIGGIALAGLVAYGAHAYGERRRRGGRSSRFQPGSIPEALTRAKRGRRHVLVAFVDPEGETSRALLEHLDGPDLREGLRHFECVRIDARKDDLEVVQHLATKYGLGKLVLPALLALNHGGEKVGSLDGGGADGEKLGGFVKMVRPGG